MDREKRTVEFYDSFASSPQICDDIAKILTAKDPGKKSYEVVYAIKKTLQDDTYQCGPWACFFLEHRLKQPHFDFNSLPKMMGKEGVEKMIALYRNKAILDISNYDQLRYSWVQEEERIHAEDYARVSDYMESRPPAEIINKIFTGTHKR